MDYVAVIGAAGGVATVFAAWFTYRQAQAAFDQLQAAKQASLEDDARRRKRVAIELGQDWCQTEAPSPFAILRECLIRCDEGTIKALLAGDPIQLPKLYEQEIRTFFQEILHGKFDGQQVQQSEDRIAIGSGYALLIRNFMARRMNFLEVVAAAFNAELGDKTLINQFFGTIIRGNPAYQTAVRLHCDGWPELNKFLSFSESTNTAN